MTERRGAEAREASGDDGYQFRTALDSWADEPTIWLVPAAAYARDTCIDVTNFVKDWEGIRLLVEKDGKLIEKRNFGKDVAKSVVRQMPPVLWRQRLYVNPVTGKLYVAEGDSSVMKSVNQLVEIDPVTGKTRIGRYGNVDDGNPVPAAGTRPPNEVDSQSAASGHGRPDIGARRSIGDDEVALFHANYVATDTDRRLFIADQGNARIVSVELGYHRDAIVPLKEVADQKK